MQEFSAVLEVTMSTNQEFLSSGGVRWLLTDEERTSIATLLDVEESTISHISGNIMNRPRATCTGCGKHSGLDDMVHNAVEAGIHSNAFVLNVLVKGPHAKSPAHGLKCSRCDSEYEGLWNWREDTHIWAA
ncbi:hypothetical protein TWF102_007079 [Orbilia oligospora]|uniref:Uncharacterized protein n=1 Tax=Orbilia oligospora TaxID=2813651 RepID=A0A7C8JGP0_ORBOL|nr:hypothetical protein TWF102_007079 [Orbilia oligospora]KAF3117235.1 hypothetical protein TWF103_007383 [Orbilia oligospora]KAF3150036.1 hypothetical protein TWF594_009941 [Orbilia oligospora]